MAAIELVRLAELDDPERVAEDAGLRYVTDQEPGIRRRRRGRGFSYRHDDGGAVNKPATLERIRRLAIPPAWTDVWICVDPQGHLQATGRDARGRKQYRYHQRWRKVRDANKFDRLFEFGSALESLRRGVEQRRSHDVPDRDTVLATIVDLLDLTLARVGNEEYAQDNETYGLTTLRNDHVVAGRHRVELQFIGKHGKRHDVTVRDPTLARMVRTCHELGGKELFTYVDEHGGTNRVTSQDVNDFLRDLVGAPGVSAKDFRTWGGTVAVAETLAELGPAATAHQADANVLAAIDEAAERLHNTRAVCRNCYVHPTVLDAYRSDLLADLWRNARRSRWYSRAERATLLALEPATRRSGVRPRPDRARRRVRPGGRT